MRSNHEALAGAHGGDRAGVQALHPTGGRLGVGARLAAGRDVDGERLPQMCLLRRAGGVSLAR